MTNARSVFRAPKLDLPRLLFLPPPHTLRCILERTTTIWSGRCLHRFYYSLRSRLSWLASFQGQAQTTIRTGPPFESWYTLGRRLLFCSRSQALETAGLRSLIGNCDSLIGSLFHSIAQSAFWYQRSRSNSWKALIR